MAWKDLRRAALRLLFRASWSRLPVDAIVRRFGTPRGIDTYMQVCFDYARDHDHRGVPDHWQDPLQTHAARRGDCEDWAVFAWHVLAAAGVEARVLCVFTEEHGHAVCLAFDRDRAVAICNEGLRDLQRRPRRSGFSHVLARRTAERVFGDRWVACAYVDEHALAELAAGRAPRPFDPRYVFIRPDG